MRNKTIWLRVKRFLSKEMYKHIIIIFLLTAGVYLGIYFVKFNKLSENINDYTAFSTYLSGLGSIASIATLIVILVENNRLLREKDSSIKKQNLLFLVEHFEINPLEETVLSRESHTYEDTDGIPTTYIHSEDYTGNLHLVYKRIQYIYDSFYLLKDNGLMDIVKNVLMNKISKNVLGALIYYYNDEECIMWLRLDNIHWHLNLAQKRKENKF